MNGVDPKERMKRYRAEMIEKGYTSTTIFLSQEHRAELKRLGDEHRLTRAEAAEHIFQAYLQSDNKDVTQAYNINTDQISEIHAAIEDLGTRLKALESKQAESNNKNATQIYNTNIESRVEPPGVMPDQPTGDSIPAPLDAIPERGTPEYSDWLFKMIDPLKRSGMSSIKIERKFNDDGVKPASTKKNKFNRGSADSFYKGRLQKMGLRWDKDLKQPVPIDKP
nr:hypothetical protein [uncultured Desulfobacter sp.]